MSYTYDTTQQEYTSKELTSSEIKNELNRRSGEGWELVQVYFEGGYRYLVFRKDVSKVTERAEDSI